MIHIVEYKLHAGSTPYFIKDGGYFNNNGKFIGVTHCDETCYVPPASDLVTFTVKQDFIDHVSALTFISASGELTTEQKEQLADDFWELKNA